MILTLASFCENPPPVLVQNPKKKQKKGKRSSKKSFCKENTEPTVAKAKEAKMFSSWDTCRKMNTDAKSIYDQLHKFTLTEIQLKMNHFPHEGFQPFTQVAADDTQRQCARCGAGFEIFNGLYLSATKCSHHPRKAAFVGGVRLHGCCNAPFGSPPCTVTNNHVTVQHRPRALSKIPARRHVRRDLQHGIFSLDCEMCYTTDGLEVVRVGLVNINGLAVYDSYIKPKGKILDYNTVYSGVEKSHLQNVTLTIEDVKTILSGLIQEDTILVGHALNNDLSALGLIHSTVVDTSVMFADPRIPSKKTALKKLALDYLGITIQDGASGHDCIDDARATLKLALLKVRRSFEETQQQQQPVAKQQAAETCLWRQPEQRPLVEIQNFNCQPGIYNHYQRAQAFDRSTSPLIYNPVLGCYTPYLRGGV